LPRLSPHQILGRNFEGMADLTADDVLRTLRADPTFNPNIVTPCPYMHAACGN
jgi:hypothetical protein